MLNSSFIYHKMNLKQSSLKIKVSVIKCFLLKQFRQNAITMAMLKLENAIKFVLIYYQFSISMFSTQKLFNHVKPDI